MAAKKVPDDTHGLTGNVSGLDHALNVPNMFRPTFRRVLDVPCGDRITPEKEIRRLKEALGAIAALGEVCQECEPHLSKMATHQCTHPLALRDPNYLCLEHAEKRRRDNIPEEDGPCLLWEIEEYEQDLYVVIAMAALGLIDDQG